MIRANGGGLGRAASRNTYNRPNAVAAKVQIRLNVLDAVKPARVFDAFCGPDGEMFEAVWARADSYVGCDTEFLLTDKRRRFVADNRRVMRSVDLQAFNVFDFDAFGSPWEQMLILAARRAWAPGERGAVVLTDGSGNKTRFGGMPAALGQLIGCRSSHLAPTQGSSAGIQSIALHGWCVKAGVRLTKMWRAVSHSSGLGSFEMVYTAIVFEGQAARENPTG